MTEKLILADFLPYRLSVLSNRVSGGIAQLYEGRFGVTLNQWRIMAVIGGEPDISAGQVAERTAMDKVAVSRSIKKLLELGHVERHFAEDDKRRSVLALSEQGYDIYWQVVPLARAWEQNLVSSLTDEEHEQLDNLINKLLASDALNEATD